MDELLYVMELPIRGGSFFGAGMKDGVSSKSRLCLMNVGVIKYIN